MSQLLLETRPLNVEVSFIPVIVSGFPGVPNVTVLVAVPVAVNPPVEVVHDPTNGAAIPNRGSGRYCMLDVVPSASVVERDPSYKSDTLDTVPSGALGRCRDLLKRRNHALMLS